MDSLKILFVGNSFAVDTMQHTAGIATALGIRNIRFGVLYVGACSIDMHYAHAMGDLPAYEYHQNTGDGWSTINSYRISDAIQSDDCDWIAIQHGTREPSRYTSPESYRNLTPLVKYIKKLAPDHTKIAFNLTWMGEHTSQHHEILSYEGNIPLMRQRLIEVTRAVVVTNPLIDLLVPTGTAIENARTSQIGLLTRDCYHLSMDKGRYIAAITFIAAITGLPIDSISWVPKGVDEYALQVAIESARNAIRAPFEITQSKILR